MSHELVFNKDGKALMFYRRRDGADLPWHGFGHAFDQTPTLEEVKDACGMNRVIRHLPVESDGKVLPDARAVWDSEGRYLGLVGTSTEILQESDLMDSLIPWIEGGFAEPETGGLLAGGRKCWMQLKLKDAEAEIVPGDSVRTHIFLGQAYDGSMSITSGRMQTRVVCNNTLRAGLREGGFLRKKHRGDVGQASIDIQAKLLEWRKEDEKVIEAFRWLASKQVAAKGVEAFVAALTGKDAAAGPEEVADKVRAGSPAERIRERFLKGIGNAGQTWWHLLNAVTEDTSHQLGNDRKGDMGGDREGRALNKLFFGAGAKMNDLAFRAAINLAGDKPVGAKLSLDLAA